MTAVIPIGDRHEGKLVLLDVVVHLTSARYGARMRVVGTGFDVEASITEELVELPGLFPIAAWVGVVHDREHSHRVVALGVWDDRDAVARTTAAVMLSVLKEKLCSGGAYET